VSLLTLAVQLLLALVKILGFSASNGNAANERATGAALQREEDMRHEEERIAAAARAGLDSCKLPIGPDPEDRDSAR
jgi:hypothetical protein